MHPDTPTRGRTAPGRLRALDAWVCRAERALLARADGPWARAPFVDVGIGDEPWTTLEAARAFRAVHPGLPVVGVDLDPLRVAAARAVPPDPRTAGEGAPVDFRVGGFDLPLAPGEAPRLLRVLNVLRGQSPAPIPAIHARLGASLLDGGLLIEGTSDPTGDVFVVHLLRRRGDVVAREGLLFYTSFAQGFAPLLFRDRLPRDVRRVAPGTPLFPFFQDWIAAWEPVRGEPASAFARSVAALATRCPGVDPDPWLAANGYLVWRPPGGVPAP